VYSNTDQSDQALPLAICGKNYHDNIYDQFSSS
jgi:hypothetical protein